MITITTPGRTPPTSSRVKSTPSRKIDPQLAVGCGRRRPGRTSPPRADHVPHAERGGRDHRDDVGWCVKMMPPCDAPSAPPRRTVLVSRPASRPAQPRHAEPAGRAEQHDQSPGGGTSARIASSNKTRESTNPSSMRIMKPSGGRRNSESVHGADRREDDRQRATTSEMRAPHNTRGKSRLYSSVPKR